MLRNSPCKPHHTNRERSFRSINISKRHSYGLTYFAFCRYAEETGDYAQRRELASIMEALDSDGDGCIGLLDFVLFAARRKELSIYSKFAQVINELRDSNDGI